MSLQTPTYTEFPQHPALRNGAIQTGEEAAMKIIEALSSASMPVAV